MERWIPIFWILGIGVGVFCLIILTEYLRAGRDKKKR
jgi:hypothetical protein